LNEIFYVFVQFAKTIDVSQNSTEIFLFVILSATCCYSDLCCCCSFKDSPCTTDL